MRSPADAALIQREHHLPGLALLLDIDTLHEVLHGAFPGRDLTDVSIDYLRYKPGTNCLAAFRASVDGCQVHGYAKAYAIDARGKLQKAYAREGVASAVGHARLVIESLLTEVVFFPNDNKLPALRSLFNQDPIALLSHTLADDPALHRGTPHLLRYKPERRAVVRLDVDGVPRALLKLHASPDFADARRAAAALANASHLLGASKHYGAFAYAWRPGHPLADVIADPAADLAPVAASGAALAALHAQFPGALDMQSRDAEYGDMLTLAEALVDLQPHLAGLVDEIVRTIAADLSSAPALHHLLHGDFYAQQVLVSDDRVELVDFDNARLGDPAADLGMAIAHLEVDALAGRWTTARAAAAREALLSGYDAHADRVDTYTALALLQLAPHHFRQREPDWSARMQATLTVALDYARQPQALSV